MVEICWLGQGGFLIATPESRVVVDPYLSDCVFKKQQLARLHPFPVALDELKPDILLISHDHMDHLDPEGVPQIFEMYPSCRYFNKLTGCILTQRDEKFSKYQAVLDSHLAKDYNLWQNTSKRSKI